MGRVSTGNTVAILGAGPIGLCTFQAVIASGASKVFITDIRDHLLKCAKRLGATEVVNAADEDPVKKILELTDGRGTDIVIEAVGSRDTIRQTFEIAGKGGRIVLIGALTEDECQIRTLNILSKELTIKGLFRYANTYPTAISLVSSGRIDLKPLITHIFPLEQIHKAFKIASEKSEDAIKVIIRI